MECRARPSLGDQARERVGHVGHDQRDGLAVARDLDALARLDAPQHVRERVPEAP